MRSADLTLALLSNDQQATLRVQGRSMWPVLVAGDHVVIEPRKEYKIGDLVAFDNGRESLVVHRLIACRDGLCRTRGDYLVQADPWLDRQQLVGVVVDVKRGWTSALYHKIFAPLWMASIHKRLRRRRAENRTWALSGRVTYLLYRTVLRPFSPSVRIVLAAPSEPREVQLPDGLTLKSGYLNELYDQLVESGLELPKHYNDSTYGMVAFDGLSEVACAWSSQVDDQYATLHDSYVLAQYRGRGLAKLLADCMFDYRSTNATMLVSVQHHNAASLAKNKRAGFQEIGREYRLRLWPTQKVWTKLSSKTGCEHLVDAWLRNGEARVRR